MPRSARTIGVSEMSQYGQFCPVAKAMELLDERWTMLVVRELLQGSQTFNMLRRGIPRMSPALLSTRLQSLARAGVIDRNTDGGRVTYRLTPAGR
jgi:DNA-binding HxlR family transcriptional regulator